MAQKQEGIRSKSTSLWGGRNSVGVKVKSSEKKNPKEN